MPIYRWVLVAKCQFCGQSSFSGKAKFPLHITNVSNTYADIKLYDNAAQNALVNNINI